MNDLSPLSAVEAIEKAMEGKNRIQGMVRSIDQYRNGDPKAVADGSYAQVLYALTDYKHDVLVLWDFAVSKARKAEALERENAVLREALKPFAQHLTEMEFDLDNKGNPIPDNLPAGWVYVPVADFRRARALLRGYENAE